MRNGSAGEGHRKERPRRIGVAFIAAIVFFTVFTPVGTMKAEGARKPDARIVKITNVKDGYTIKTGNSKTLTAKVTPAKGFRNYRWTTSNKSVLSVTGAGKIKAKKPGSARVKVYAGRKGKRKSASVKIKVVPTKVRNVKISGEFASCFVGRTIRLEASVSPFDAYDKEVQWTSEDPDIASVSESGGKVTGISPGKTTIYATAKDGSGVRGEYTLYVYDRLDTSGVDVVAHRGAPKLYPENTLQGFRAVAALPRYTGVETDIWECRKMEGGGTASIPYFLVMHDENIKRMCGVNKKITDITLEKKNDYPIVNGNGNDPDEEYIIPSLEEFIDTVKDSHLEIIIEVKTSDSSITESGAWSLINTLKEKGIYDRTSIISFDRESLKTIMEMDEDGGLKYYTSLSNTTSTWEKDFRWCAANGVTHVSIAKGRITRSIVDLAHSKGITVGAYTVNDPEEAADLIRLGVDSISTDTHIWEL